MSEQKVKHSEMRTGPWADQPSKYSSMHPKEKPVPVGNKALGTVSITYVRPSTGAELTRGFSFFRFRRQDKLQPQRIRLLGSAFESGFGIAIIWNMLKDSLSDKQVTQKDDSTDSKAAKSLKQAYEKVLRFIQENEADEHSAERPTAGEEEIASELVEIVDSVLAIAPLEQTIHLTRGIRGPSDTNRFGLSMDFDMAVLWVAAWYRRGKKGRKRLLKNLEGSDQLCSAFGSKKALEAWTSEMDIALRSIVPDSQMDSEPMSLTEITAMIKKWNLAGGSLRGPEGNDLLAQIGTRKDLNRHLILLLVGERGQRTIFTTKYDVSPGWTALNFLRHWTVVGRENRLPASIYGPREPQAFLQSWMASDPVGKK